ncbi:MAG: MFS transporter [Pseudomonadota bacterium]
MTAPYPSYGEHRRERVSHVFLATMVSLTLLMNTLGRGVTETFTVFLLPVEETMQATRAEMTLAYSIYMLVNGVSAPIAGQMIDRLGGRLTYGIGLAFLGSGFWLAGHADALWQYYLFYSVYGGFGAAALGMVAASSLLSRWFTKRLGTVVAIPHAATGLGVLLIPPLAQFLMGYFSWQQTHQIIGAGVLVMIPFVLLLPLGAMSRGSELWRAQRRAARASGAQAWTALRAIQTEAFWSLFLVFFFTSVAAYAVIPQCVAFLVESGFDPLFAASAFGVSGLFSAIGIFASGWFSDRIGRLTIVTITKVLTMTGIASLIMIVWYPNLLFVYMFVFFFGIVQGARGPIIAVLVSLLFRGGSVGAIFGTLSLAMGLGAGGGSWLSGALHDWTDGYFASFTLGFVASALGLAVYWISPSLRRERPARI